MSPIVQWGPALLVLLGILFGVLYNNRSIGHLDKRIDDLIRHEETQRNDSYGNLSRRIDDLIRHEETQRNDSYGHLSRRIDDLIRHQDAQHADLKDFIKSEIRRLEERIGRLEQPIVRS